MHQCYRFQTAGPLVLAIAAFGGCGGGSGAASVGTSGDTGGATTSTTGSAGTSTSGGAQAVTGTTGDAQTVTSTTGDAETVTSTGAGGATSSSTAVTGAAGSGGVTGTSTSNTSGGELLSGEFTVDAQLASDVDPSAPTTVGIITWSIEGVTPSEAYVEFGLDTNYGTHAPVDLSETGFRTLLLGMKPEHVYNYRVVVSDGTNSYASDNYTIETGAPTTAVSIGSFDSLSEARERGFMIMSYRGQNADPMVFILDADGEIVWWYDTGSANGIGRARMSYDGKNIWTVDAVNGNGGPVRRVSMDTLDGETYSTTAPGGSHDLTAISGSTMAFIDYSESDCDSVFEIDPSGQVREIWESNDILAGSGGGMGCHLNAVRYSQTEDVFTVSNMTTDVYVLDRSGNVLWTLSERVGSNSVWNGRQHGHQLLDNSMLVFANAGGSGQASAVIEYDLEGNEIFRYDSGEETANLGDVQRLPGGDTLVTYSNSGIVHQIDEDGNLLLTIDSDGSSMGYTMWRETLYGPPPDIAL